MSTFPCADSEKGDLTTITINKNTSTSQLQHTNSQGIFRTYFFQFCEYREILLKINKLVLRVFVVYKKRSGS